MYMPLNFYIKHDKVAKFDTKSVWFSGFVSKKVLKVLKTKQNKINAGH